MPQIIITEQAAKGLVRCYEFLSTKNPMALLRAKLVIKQRLSLLKTEPLMGRPCHDLFDYRELVIPFGEAGYTALYRYDPSVDLIYVLAFRHQKEAGY